MDINSRGYTIWTWVVALFNLGVGYVVYVVHGNFLGLMNLVFFGVIVALYFKRKAQ